ncbi:tumor protein p53-inducible protein 13 isoform X2 [Manis javanica]|uniref:tumor protein p53-inducible protein 13 isoform X2 n=1 Tax=Manis javanica TaxID=9974 RepID=UPI003C6D7EC1
MAPPTLSSRLLLLAALAGLLGPSEVSPRVTYTRMSPQQLAYPDLKLKHPSPSIFKAQCRSQLSLETCLITSALITFSKFIGAQEFSLASSTAIWHSAEHQAEAISFLYHPCAHPWLKLQLALLAHVCMAKPSLAPDSSLTQDRPLVLAAWGVLLEMAWVEPAWAARWLKRRRRRKLRKKAWFRSSSLSRSSPLVPAPGRGRLCRRGCVQAPALAFTLHSWRPPGTDAASRGPWQRSPGGAKKRELRAALSLQSTPSALRGPAASHWSSEAKQPMMGAPSERGNAPSVPNVSLLPWELGSNASSRIEAQVPKEQSSRGGCACPSQASPAPRAAAPPRAARGPTPRTEEAAWAAMALTFLLVLLTLATLCTRLHRNFRRGESIYWEPTADGQDTVAAVLKRRLLMPPRRVKRSRRRPLLPPTPDSGPEVDSSD